MNGFDECSTCMINEEALNSYKDLALISCKQQASLYTISSHKDVT